MELTATQPANLPIIIGLDDLKAYLQDFADRVSDAAVEKAISTHIVEEKPDDLLKINEVLGLLKISRTTLWEWERTNYLVPAFRVGSSPRYRRSDVEKFIK